MNCLVTVGHDGTMRRWDTDLGLCRGTWPTAVGHSRRYLALDRGQGAVVGTLVDKGGGVQVVKLWRERPVMAVYQHHLYFVRGGWLVHYNRDRVKETRITRLQVSGDR